LYYKENSIHKTIFVTVLIMPLTQMVPVLFSIGLTMTEASNEVLGHILCYCRAEAF
jgi:uncharacterized membrane protein YagU involved in acid resistance